MMSSHRLDLEITAVLKPMAASAAEAYQPGIEQPLGSILGARHVDAGAGLTWGASGFECGRYPGRYNAQASVSYVTGSRT